MLCSLQEVRDHMEDWHRYDFTIVSIKGECENLPLVIRSSKDADLTA